MCVCVCSVVQFCPSLCDPVDCSLTGSSVHGSYQAGLLEWVAMPSSTGSSWPRDQTCVSCTDRHVLYHSHHLGSPQGTNRGEGKREQRRAEIDFHDVAEAQQSVRAMQVKSWKTSMLVRVLLGNKTHSMCVCVCEIYREEATRIIMEAEKSHSLLSVSQRPRKHVVLVVQKPESPRTNVADFSLNLEAWEPGVLRTEEQFLSSSSQAEKKFNLPPAFCLFRPSTDRWCPATLERAICFT